MYSILVTQESHAVHQGTSSCKKLRKHQLLNVRRKNCRKVFEAKARRVHKNGMEIQRLVIVLHRINHSTRSRGRLMRRVRKP